MISHGKPKLPSAKEHPYCAATASEATVEIRSNAVSATAVLKAAPAGIIPDATQLRVTLYAGQPWLDLEWSIANKTPDPWPEGGWLCFPLRADDPTFRLARLGSIVDPAKDLVRGIEPRDLLPQRRSAGQRRRRRPHGHLPDRRPIGEPGAPRLVALFARFRGPQARRVRDALQ